MSCRSFFFFQNSEFWLQITLCGFTSRYGPFFHYWNSFTFRWPCLYYTFLSLSGCNHMFKSFFEATGQNIWAVVLFFSFKIPNFGWKSFLVGSHLAMGPFSVLKFLTFRWPCLYYTFLSLSGCNHMFKSFFEATAKNIWAIVLFFQGKNLKHVGREKP